jgi:ComF family protein
MSLIGEFIGLFFPRLCQACENLLYKNEETLCTRCLATLPKTNFHRFHDNPVMEVFWGRVSIHSASSYLYYSKAGKTQHLIHRFKYHGKREVGQVLSRMFADELKDSPDFRHIDAIIPVPLHWTKLKTRGFNQSEVIAFAMAPKLGAAVIKDVLIRHSATDTQTKKSRSQRLENVKGKFGVENSEKIAGKHVLIVDDIITTGSTIEACALLMTEIPGVKVSLASLGFAGK